MGSDLNALQDIIGYRFKDESLLNIALTHSSTGLKDNYERLEFLGDRVLGLIIAAALYERFPHEKEGDLAKRLAALVQGRTLAKLSAKIQLGSFIHFSDGEAAAGGAENDHILADVFEALLGALYRDGGYVSCETLVHTIWEDVFDTMKKPPQHPKTVLQEWLQAQGLSLPAYEIVAQDGPNHAPIFHIRLAVDGYRVVQASGASRAAAEKAVAKLFIEQNLNDESKTT